MVDIRHRVGIAAPAAEVHEALTTIEGLAGFWSRDADGDPQLGGKLRFYFGNPEPRAVMEVVGLTPTHVEWRCVDGPDEWVDTNLTFDLHTSEGETIVRFTHADWREPVEFMEHCSTKWGYFLLGLKGWLEGGESVAYPADLKISSWG